MVCTSSPAGPENPAGQVETPWSIFSEQNPVLMVSFQSAATNPVSLLTKSDVWTYEREYRLIAQERGSSTPHDTLFTDNNYLKLPEGTLTSIIVGCQGPFEDIQKLVAEFAPRVSIRRAVRIPNLYSVRIE
jgi:hypothetical protein